MKASKASIGRAVDQPNSRIRFYLFHGPDESQSRSLAARLLEASGASKFLVAAGSAKSDPASLVDEAGAMSLFGGRRAVWIEPATKDIEEGVAALLEAPASESPVIAIAGALTKTSALLKLAEASPLAIAYASYAPEGQDAARMVIDLGRRFGLKVAPPVAERLAGQCGNDQAIVAQELQKLALFIDASPHAPKELDHEAIDAVGADTAEGDYSRLADLALAGDVAELGAELSQLPPGGSEAIPVVRSLQRRLLMLAPARARVERGERVDAVMTSLGKSLFWKDKPIVAKMLSQWDGERLARIFRACRASLSGRSCSVPLRSRKRSAKNCWRSPAKRGAVEPLDRLAREPLTDHVELVEARIMQGDRAALPLVHDIDANAEKIAELPLEGFEVGVDRLGGIACARPRDVLTGTRFRTSGTLFRLTDRQALLDDFPGQRFGVGRGRDGSRMPHADIAFQ